jgi:hypothetical protein
MIDDFSLAAIYAAWLALSTMPLGFMLGSSCSPCCGSVGCGIADAKPRTDPATEGVWTPSGTWRGVGGVTWTYSATPSTTDGGTWFFYGSASTSKVGGGASAAERQDWGNICNWYSNKTNSPSSTANIATVLNKRATRLPPSDAIVFIYSPFSTSTSGPATFKNAYFYSTVLETGSNITCTDSAHDSPGGTVIYKSNNLGTINGGASFIAIGQSSVVNDGAVFSDESGSAAVYSNDGTINGGCVFNDRSRNIFGVVNGGATFNHNSRNFISAVVNGGATFNDDSRNWGETNVPVVNGGATFNDNSQNYFFGEVNGGATFNDNSENVLFSTVNDGAVFNGNSRNDFSTVNGGAVFNDNSVNNNTAVVNGGATFNDAACTERTTGTFANCPGASRRRFVAHPTDLPVCNGTAPDGCVNSADTCGCG